MEENGTAPGPARGPTGNLLREVLRTTPLKEILLLQMKGIDPGNAAKLVETALWEDPSVSLGLIGSAPGMANWLLEFLLEVGRQLDDLPFPLLGEILGKTGAEIDRGRLKELREVYARLSRKLVMDVGASGEDRAKVSAGINAALAGADRLTSGLDADNSAALAFARAVDGIDAETLGRLLNRLITLGNEARRSRRAAAREQRRAVLSQLDGREVFAMVGWLLRSAASLAWSLVTLGARSLSAERRR